MDQFNSIDEILDFAITAEIDANKFYKDLAQKTQNATMKQVFMDFAAEEKKHQLKLESIKNGKNSPPDFSEPVPDLKIADYVRDVEPTDDMDYQSALILAMKKEKNAYKMYSDLAKATKDHNFKNLFLSLAHEEANHKLRFELEYDHVIFEGN